MATACRSSSTSTSGRSSAASALPTRGTRIAQLDPPGPDNASNTSAGSGSTGGSRPRCSAGTPRRRRLARRARPTRTDEDPPRPTARAGSSCRTRRARPPPTKGKRRRAQPRDHVRLRHRPRPGQRRSELDLHEIEGSFREGHRKTNAKGSPLGNARVPPRFHPVGMRNDRRAHSDAERRSHCNHGSDDMTVSSETLRSISTPEHLDSRLGTLEFADGVPSAETAETVYDHLDFVHALNVFLDGYRGSVDVRDPQGLPRRRRGRQPDPHLLGADGVGVGVPDRERRHGLLPRRRRSHVGADGRRDAAAGARGVRRHVVGVDHRLRPAGPGSRRRRPFPARPAGLRRPAAGQRLPRRALAHVAGAPARALVPDGRRPGADGRDDQAHAEALPLRAGRLRHERRDAARGRRAARSTGGGARDGVRGGKREGVQHGAAERLRLLRADERDGPGRARRQHGRRAHGTAGRDRDRQGRAVRARRADAAHPRGRGRRRERRPRGRCSSTPRASEGFAYYDDSAWFNMLWVGGYTFETPPPLVTEEGIKPFPATGVRKLHSRTVVLVRGHRGHARDVHAAHRDRVAVPHGQPRTPTAIRSTARRPTG